MNIVTELKKYIGEYSGEGINHEQQKFLAEFKLGKIVSGKGFELNFLAKGTDGSMFHEEKSLLCSSLDETLTLWNFNNNCPGLVPHKLDSVKKTDGGLELKFNYNDLSNQNLFREEVKLQLFDDGNMGYHYSWGMPEGEFKERSGLVMSKKNSEQSYDLNHLHLAVGDLAQSKSFYAEKLGFKYRITHGKTEFFENSQGFDLALDPEVKPEKLPGWFHIGIRCSSVADIENIYSKFPENSEFISRPIERYDDFIFFHLKDPDGYKIEVYWE